MSKERFIAVSYPAYDFSAAAIANKIALEKPEDTYLIPKHHRRKWEEVFRRLNEAKGLILFIAEPDVEIDKKTLKELKVVADQNKPIFVMYPICNVISCPR